MAVLSDETIRYLQSSPYFAILEGRDENGQRAFDTQFDSLPKPIRDFLLSPETAEEIISAGSAAQIPDTYRTAVSKIVGLGALGEIPITGIKDLLVTLKLSEQQSAFLAEKLQVILGPVIAERAKQSVPSMQQLPPLTQKIPEQVPPMTVTQSQSKNVVDLRKQQQPQ